MSDDQPRTGLDQLDPTIQPARDATQFRRLLATQDHPVATESDVREAVAAAREAGDSWTVIGAALDITRQAAQQRFSS